MSENHEKRVPVAVGDLRIAAEMLRTMYGVLHQDRPGRCSCETCECEESPHLIVERGGQSRNITKHVPVVIEHLEGLTRQSEAEGGGILSIPDLLDSHEGCGFQECRLWDEELECIHGSGSLVEAVDSLGQTVSRQDKETGEVWVLCWIRLPNERGQDEGPTAHAMAEMGHLAKEAGE